VLVYHKERRGIKHLPKPCTFHALLATADRPGYRLRPRRALGSRHSWQDSCRVAQLLPPGSAGRVLLP
ncbi:hypothetical protein ANANG_G00250930, partial [Anguilla anguilla]